LEDIFKKEEITQLYSRGGRQELRGGPKLIYCVFNNRGMNMLLGVGNTWNGDDGIGPWVAQQLQDENWGTIDCGTAPESFTSSIKKAAPCCLVIVDAAEMNLPAGEMRIIPKEKIDESCLLSTHSLPLSMIITYLEEAATMIVLVGIQPKRLRGPLSREARNAGMQLIDMLKNEALHQLKTLK
jgi:hydrogenase 3 maturation protease